MQPQLSESKHKILQIHNFILTLYSFLSFVLNQEKPYRSINTVKVYNSLLLIFISLKGTNIYRIQPYSQRTTHNCTKFSFSHINFCYLFMIFSLCERRFWKSEQSLFGAAGPFLPAWAVATLKVSCFNQICDFNPSWCSNKESSFSGITWQEVSLCLHSLFYFVDTCLAVITILVAHT